MNLSPALFPSRQSLLFRSGICLAGFCGLLVAAAPLAAQGTRLWSQTKFEEFEKGVPQGVAITSDGHLRLGPAATELLTTPSSFVWSVAVDKAGKAYLATSSPATVLRVDDSGTKSGARPGFQKLFETKALAVQVLRVGPDGALYAATIPDGKVYRIKPDAAKPADETSAEVVFDLSKAEEGSSKPAGATDENKKQDKSRYIWDMTFDAAGRLYIATGGPGIIYRVRVSDAKPTVETFFTSDESHIRVLAWDKAGNLLAGSDGSGLVYRIDPAGKAYVLFSAPRREITALTVGGDGTIFVSDVGDKSRSPLPALPIQNGTSSITISFVQPGSLQAANASLSLPDGTEVYALKTDNAPRKLWSGKDEIVYRLQWTPAGIVALTGNRGRILRINPADGSFSDIAHLEAQQAVSITESGAGWLIGTANTGKLIRLAEGTSSADTHTFASDVFDAGATARWGRIEVQPGSHGFQILTRSGNVEQPIRNARDWGWSAWQPTADGKVVSPAGRYLQWKAVLSDGGDLAQVGINFLGVNAAPAVDDVLVVPGARVIPQPPQNTPPTIQIAFASPQTPSFDASAANASAPIQAQKDKTAVTVRWAAHDDNGDELVYDLYLRGDEESHWRLLKKGITEKVYSFDAASIPDGGYQIKVVASDAPSHTPGEVLTGEQVSDRFEIDTTPPVISGLKAVAAKPVECVRAPCPASLGVTVSFDAKDAASPIVKAEYSVDAGPWQYIEPAGGLSDSQQEHYAFPVTQRTVADAGADGGDSSSEDTASDQLVTVRVYDRHDNMAVAKVLAPGPTQKSSRTEVR